MKLRATMTMLSCRQAALGWLAMEGPKAWHTALAAGALSNG
jgi:hypothetical protein